MNFEQTPRGFLVGRFKDRYGAKCSLQESSLAEEAAVWFGIDDPEPKIMCSDAAKLGLKRQRENGWQDYYIPKEVLLNTRMHLTQSDVKILIPILRHFAETGYLPKTEKAEG